MTKILFLPFLETKTGHHKVADALICSLASRLPNASLKKVDVLSFSHPKFEKVFIRIFLLTKYGGRRVSIITSYPIL